MIYLPLTFKLIVIMTGINLGAVFLRIMQYYDLLSSFPMYLPAALNPIVVIVLIKPYRRAILSRIFPQKWTQTQTTSSSSNYKNTVGTCTTQGSSKLQHSSSSFALIITRTPMNGQQMSGHQKAQEMQTMTKMLQLGARDASCIANK